MTAFEAIAVISLSLVVSTILGAFALAGGHRGRRH